MIKTKTLGRRHSYYLREINAALDAARLGPRQRERVMEPGWTKVRLYCRLLSRDEDSVNHYEKWTAFAVANPTEVVRQAVERGRPSVPLDQRVRTILFRLPVGVRDELIEALKLRGWEFEPDQRGGLPRRPRDGDERAVRKLLRDAARGRRTS